MLDTLCVCVDGGGYVWECVCVCVCVDGGGYVWE